MLFAIFFSFVIFSTSTNWFATLSGIYGNFHLPHDFSCLGIITSEVKCFILNNLFFSFSSVQSLSCVRLFVTPWITACQVPLSITSSQSLLKLMSIESVMPSIHLILCCPLLLLPPIPLSIRVFSNKPTLCISLLKEKSWVVLFPWEKVQTWQPKPFPQFH